MAEIVFLLPARDVDSLHRTLSMLSFQKDHGFRAVIVDLAGSEAVRALAADFEHQFPVTAETIDPAGQPLWKCCLDAAPAAEWVCFLTPGIDLNATSVKRMKRCIDKHSDYDVFRWNLADPNRKWGLKTRPERVFTRVFVDKDEAPLSSFVFRAKPLREAFETDFEAAGMGLAIILSAAKKSGVRTVRWERVGFTTPVPSTDPAVVEKEVRSRLAFFRWSERFFGDDYPLDVGDRLDLFATELVRLYPSFTPDELKEDMNTFAVVNGPIRRMRASSALKSALKARQETLTTPSSEK
ncbi:MAG: hypothetical protein IKV62_04925 [Bacteroidales bacterium]|nr:hypothetical protein [Bacteroidales bacterium]